MKTEEGEEVKEDEEVEFDVVEGADSPLVDDVGSCGFNEAAMLFSVVRGETFEETDRNKKQRKNFAESPRTEKNRS